MVNVKDIVKAGGRLEGVEMRKMKLAIVNSLACKIVGLLADAPSPEIRRQALGKAKRMIGTK